MSTVLPQGRAHERGADAPPRFDPRPARRAFDVVWARHPDEIRAAQRLRHAVFAGELGARLAPVSPALEGHDIDVFDPFCEHLLLRTQPQEDEPPTVVGTYRVLTPTGARRAGGYYSETEFDLTRLRSLRPGMVEFGRACVHPQWRDGGAILAMWSALADLVQRNGWHTVIGCASIGMQDGGHVAASLWQRLHERHASSIEWQVRARLPLPVEELRRDLVVEAPPLLKGYLRCGAQLIGPPAWDPDFRTADLPLMLRVADLPARFRRAGGAG